MLKNIIEMYILLLVARRQFLFKILEKNAVKFLNHIHLYIKKTFSFYFELVGFFLILIVFLVKSLIGLRICGIFYIVAEGLLKKWKTKP